MGGAQSQPASNFNNIFAAMAKAQGTPAPAPQPQPQPILPQAINFVQAQVPPTPNPAAVCTTNKITLNNLENQMEETQKKVDSCDPSVKVARETAKWTKDIQTFVNTQNSQFQKTISQVQQQYKSAMDLTESIRLLKEFDSELTAEEHTARKESQELNNNIRTYRRDFLDNQPEEGVPWHHLGLQTADDKAMLAFWVSTTVLLSLLSYYYVRRFRVGQSLTSNLATGFGLVLGPLIASYLAIMYYG